MAETESLYDAALDDVPQFEEPVEEEPEPEQEEDTKLHNLLYNGYITDIVYLGDREIRIRTLKIGEELEASLLADPWKDTSDAGRALATALVAASIVTIDGEPLLTPLGPKDKELEAKFKYLRKEYYWITIRHIYNHYDALVTELLEAYEQLKKD